MSRSNLAVAERPKVPRHIQAAAEWELRRRYEPARSTMSGFVAATMPNAVQGWFHDRIDRELDQFLEDVLAGKNPRLMLIAPPRHGKSERASRRFPAYVFGKLPKTQFIATSYASDLAQRMNRDVQRIIDEPKYRLVFPDTYLNTQNISTLSGQPLRNSSIFEIVKHLGAYRSAGVGQGITGMGFDVGLIDDPVKDAAQANSEVERNAIWEWYEQTFYTRASPLSGILLIMTRWHEDDLAGRLLHKMEFEGGDQWKVVRFPAIAEEDEYCPYTGKLLRKEGEALHPERFPIERLTQLRSVIGSYAFAALYQGRPTPKGGGIIKKEDFRFYRRADLVGVEFELVVLSTDAAFKDTNTSSYVVTQAWGRIGIKHYLLAQSRKRLTFSNTLKELRTWRKDRFPSCNAILIEDKANGPAIIDTLSTELPGIIAVEPMGSKQARAEAVVPLFESGNVLLPHPDEEPWVETFMQEWLAVPTGAFWDQVDSCSQYLNRYGKVVVVKMGDAMVAESAVEMNDSGSPWSFN